MSGKRQGKFRCCCDVQIHVFDDSIRGIFDRNRLNGNSAILLHGVINNRQYRHIHTDGIITNAICFLDGQGQILSRLVCFLCPVIPGRIRCSSANFFHSCHQGVNFLLLHLQNFGEVSLLGRILRQFIFCRMERPIAVDLHQPTTQIKCNMEQCRRPFLGVQA